MPRYSPLRFRVFDTCRLRYKYQYLDKARAYLRPSDTAGSLVHRVLCDFFSKVLPEERTEGRLIQLYEEGWQALSPNYKRVPGVEAYYEAGLRQVRNFTRCFDLAARPFAVEAFFQTEVAPGITLFGRMDRIDEEPDGSLHIIDYKTGEQPGEIDAKQLRLYAIMVEQELKRPVSRASFWYLDDGSVWTMDLSEADKRQAFEETAAAAHEMESMAEFPPAIGPHCAYCPYLRSCEFRDEIAARREQEGW
jgi:putative RecB family exonuclease